MTTVLEAADFAPILRMWCPGGDSCFSTLLFLIQQAYLSAYRLWEAAHRKEFDLGS